MSGSNGLIVALEEDDDVLSVKGLDDELDGAGYSTPFTSVPMQRLHLKSNSPTGGQYCEFRLRLQVIMPFFEVRVQYLSS